MQSYNCRRAKEFQEKKLFVAENVAALNDFIIEDTDSADSQTNPTFQRSPVEVSGFGKFLTSFFTRLFLGNEPSVYSGKVRLGDAGTRVNGSAVHHRLLFVFVPAWRFTGEKCTSSK